MRYRKLLALIIAPVFALGIAACDVDQTEEGELPDVEVEEGQMPEYDVDAADVEVTEDTVTVPDVDIEMPEDTGDMGPAESGMDDDGMGGGAAMAETGSSGEVR